MGQGQSADAPPPTLEQLTQTLTHRIATKSFTPLELYCFRHTFHTLADKSSGISHWSESTLCRFLELPDALGVGSVLFHMASYLGAFPFPSQAPAILTEDAMLRVIAVLTGRIGRALGKGKAGVGVGGKAMWRREVYRSLAIFDRGMEGLEEEKGMEKQGGKSEEKAGTSAQGFAVDVPEDGDEEGGVGQEDDDELVLAALDSMDAVEVFKYGEQSNVRHSIIPTDNFLKLVELVLLIAPIEPQQSLSAFASQLENDRIEELRRVGSVIMASFGGVEDTPGVGFRTFDAVISACMPYMFEGLHPLFEHFLFAKDFDLSKRKNSASSPSLESHPVIPPPKVVADPEPLLREPGEILSLTLLSQLSFFMKGTDLFRRLRPLYSGNTHGFSMGSFEKQVFNWRAPSILLVSGTLLPAHPSSARERSFAESLPPRRYPSSVPEKDASSTTLIFGAYIPVQWKHTGKSCFGDEETKLFQLSPVHDVFSTSKTSRETDYISFAKPPIRPPGISFGTPIPSQSSSHTHSSSSTIRPGPVSLYLDDALEFATFTHLASVPGTFSPSQLPHRKSQDFQDRFEIEAIEVWGCGGDEVAEQQRREWAFQEREAEARRRINLGTGDVDADRELLKMAGLVGAGRSGGSMG